MLILAFFYFARPLILAWHADFTQRGARKKRLVSRQRLFAFSFTTLSASPRLVALMQEAASSVQAAQVGRCFTAAAAAALGPSPRFMTRPAKNGRQPIERPHSPARARQLAAADGSTSRATAVSCRHCRFFDARRHTAFLATRDAG